MDMVNAAPQHDPQFAGYASRYPPQPLIPEQPPLQIVRCHHARMQPQDALGQLANSNLRSYLRLYLDSPRPPSVGTLGHQAIPMPNETRTRVGAGVSVGLGLGVEKVDLTGRTGESGRYAMSNGAICRG